MSHWGQNAGNNPLGTVKARHERPINPGADYARLARISLATRQTGSDSLRYILLGTWNGELDLDVKSTSASRPVKQLHETVQRLLDNISDIVLGKRDVASLCMTAMLAGEHILLEDVPGVGKTLLGKAIARSVNGEFRRIQFTPDLLPSDIIGSSIFKSSTSEFLFQPGPVFGNFLLADEINRSPPRTQSALLEAMSDQQVSVDGKTHSLPDPFMVIATQNPFEFEGTYALPESQLDRFLLRISMGYPAREYEQKILANHRSGDPLENVRPICDIDEIVEIRNAVREVKFDDSISQYLLNVVAATRETDELSYGVSTRGALLWYRACQAVAFIDGRNYVIPDDPRNLAVHVIAHRVQVQGVMQGTQRQEVETIVRRIVSKIPLPT